MAKAAGGAGRTGAVPAGAGTVVDRASRAVEDFLADYEAGPGFTGSTADRWAMVRAARNLVNRMPAGIRDTMRRRHIYPIESELYREEERG